MRCDRSFRRPAISAFVAFTLLVFFSNALGVSARAQYLTWSTPERDTTTEIGGEYDETGVAGVVHNAAMYVAYTGFTTDTAGNLYIASNTNGGINYGNKSQITLSTGQALTAASNPAIASFNGNLYVAYIDAYGDASFVVSSDNGEHWGSQLYNCSTSATITADSSPSLIPFNGYLWMGYRDHKTNALVMCRITTANATSASEYGSILLNFHPALAVFQNKLYVAIESRQDSHTLYFYTSPDGSNYTLQNGASGDQAGTAPSMAVHNNVLYLGFRSNDGSRVFLYKYSTDGVNFSSSAGGGWGEGGPPALVDSTGMTGSPYNGQLYVLFSSQTTGYNYLCSSHGS